jgi:hypothetical protein
MSDIFIRGDGCSRTLKKQGNATQDSMVQDRVPGVLETVQKVLEAGES